MSRATLTKKYENALAEKAALTGLAYRFKVAKNFIALRQQEAEDFASRMKKSENYIQELLNEFGGAIND